MTKLQATVKSAALPLKYLECISAAETQPTEDRDVRETQMNCNLGEVAVEI